MYFLKDINVMSAYESSKRHVPTTAIGLHIYAYNFLEQHLRSNKIYAIFYLLVMSLMCIGFYGYVAYQALSKTSYSRLSEALFFVRIVLTRFVNFCAMGLYPTHGEPLNMLLAQDKTQLLASIGTVLVANVFVDSILQKYFNNTWKNMYSVYKEEEDKAIKEDTTDNLIETFGIHEIFKTALDDLHTNINNANDETTKEEVNEDINNFITEIQNYSSQIEFETKKEK